VPLHQLAPPKDKHFPFMPLGFSPMPRLYFHVREGDHLFEDCEGVRVDDISQARQEALEVAQELWDEAAEAGERFPADAFVISNEQGHEVMLIRIPEGLPKRQ
jgi:hypothetical protein